MPIFNEATTGNLKNFTLQGEDGTKSQWMVYRSVVPMGRFAGKTSQVSILSTSKNTVKPIGSMGRFRYIFTYIFRLLIFVMGSM